MIDNPQHQYTIDGRPNRNYKNTFDMWRQNTSAFGNSDEAIIEHMKGALDRLASGTDATQPLPEEMIRGLSTSELEPVKRYSKEELEEIWRTSGKGYEDLWDKQDSPYDMFGNLRPGREEL